MPTLTDTQIAAAANAGGFSGLNQVIAVAVALAESSGNSTAIAREPNGTTSYGLWQINSIHSDLLKANDWQNPNNNALMANAIFRQRGNTWLPWSVYNNQKYLLYMERARKAVPNSTQEDLNKVIVTPVDWTDNVPGLSSAKDIVAFFKWISDAHNWYRVSIIAVGVLLLGIAIVMMLKGSIISAIPIGKIGKVAKLAGKLS